MFSMLRIAVILRQLFDHCSMVEHDRTFAGRSDYYALKTMGVLDAPTLQKGEFSVRMPKRIGKGRDVYVPAFKGATVPQYERTAKVVQVDYEAVALIQRLAQTRLRQILDRLKKELKKVQLEHSQRGNVRNHETVIRSRRIRDNVDAGKDPYDGLSIRQDKIDAGYIKLAKAIGPHILEGMLSEKQELEAGETVIYDGGLTVRNTPNG